MRTVILMLLLVLSAPTAFCQRNYLLQPPPEEPVKEDSVYDATNESNDAAIKGSLLFSKGLYARAEKYLRQSFQAYPDEATARNLYYSLVYQGYDLEAADFKKKHYKYAFALPAVKRGFEQIYVEFGPRVSVPPDTAGNIYYGSYGGFFRVSDKVRIWHSVTYLQQDDNLGKFKQGDYFSAIYVQLANSWMLKPAFHYVYTGFTTSYQEKKQVTYADTVGERNPVIYRTTADQVIRYNNPGTAHYVYVALPVSKRINTWTFEAHPSIHLIPSKNKSSYTYTSTGYTDSIRNNEVKGTKQYYEAGSGQLNDTSTLSFVGQLGASVGWKLPFLNERLSIRAAAFYLFDNDGESAMAYNAGLTCLINSQFRVYATWMTKGGLPFSLDAEGQYFNHYNKISNRTGITVHLFPLKQFSSMITYQYEQQERYLDATTLKYHSVYLTLKYRL